MQMLQSLNITVHPCPDGTSEPPARQAGGQALQDLQVGTLDACVTRSKQGQAVDTVHRMLLLVSARRLRVTTPP